MLQTKKSQQHRAQVLSKRLEEYRTARRRLVQQLEELDTQARATQLEFNSLRNYIAPIASLPEEVLAIVFEAGTHLEQAKGLYFALLVSHVIRNWRHIALATPRLWAAIRCYKPVDMRDEPYPETVREKTAAFLARSKSSPLEIYIRDFLDESPFIQLLGNHFGRCRHLSITDSKNTTMALACFSHQPAPLLESLEFGMQYMISRATKPLFPSGVPHLKIAQINRLDFVSFRSCLAAFQSVTSLRLKCLFTGDHGGDLDAYKSFRDGLMALPSLSHLELHDIYDYHRRPPTPFGQLPVMLPALQVLDAYSPFTYGFLDFLGPFIHAASLTVLTLQPGGSRVEDTLDVHFPSVRHLTLLGITRQIPGLGILRQFPSIQRLTCSFPPIIRYGDQNCGIDDVLSALGPGTHEDENPSHRTPCPQLHTIALSDMSPVDRQLDVVALTSKISALQHDGISISKLMLPRSVFSRPGLDWEAIAELRKLVEIEDFQIDRPTPFACQRFSRFEEL